MRIASGTFINRGSCRIFRYSHKVTAMNTGVAMTKISCRSSRASQGARNCQRLISPLSSSTVRIMSINTMAAPQIIFVGSHHRTASAKGDVLLRQGCWPIPPPPGQRHRFWRYTAAMGSMAVCHSDSQACTGFGILAGFGQGTGYSGGWNNGASSEQAVRSARVN